MLTMTNAYPMEFRRDVVQVARHREPGVTLEKIAADFGIHPITLSTWLKKADIEDGVKPGITSAESAELREANKRIRLLEQEAEVLKRALAYVSQGALPGKSITRS
jgi:transposase-like protein